MTKRKHLKAKILEFLRERKEEFISTSEIAKYCNKKECEIYFHLYELSEQGIIERKRRFLCPYDHIVKLTEGNFDKYKQKQDYTFCKKCKQHYSNELLTIAIFAKSKR